MTEKDDEDFGDSSKSWIYENVYVCGDVQVRDHCHITRKQRCPFHRVWNIKVKLNYKFPVVLYNLKNNDSHLIMWELYKFDFKRNVIPNGLEKRYALISVLN